MAARERERPPIRALAWRRFGFIVRPLPDRRARAPGAVLVPSQRAGTIAIFVAKIVFMAAGYALVIGLTRSLTQEEFGDYSVVFGAVALINMVVINGTLQTVSRFVAAHPERAPDVRRRAFRYQAAFATLIIGAVVLGADLISAALRDAALAPLLRAAMVITAIYAFYAINVGSLNGEKRFTSQAALDISFSVFKVGLILLATALGYGLYGVVAGFAGAAALVLVGSFSLTGLPRAGSRSASEASDGLSAKDFIRFAFSVMGVALLLNCVMQADLFLLKALSPIDEADATAGLYGAAQQLARIPYYLMVTASLVLFPVVASLDGKTEAARARRADTVSQAFTGILGLVVGMAAVTAPISGRVLRVIYPAAYVDAAPAFPWLVTALVVLTLVNVGITMISGAGRPGVSVAILVATLVVQVVAAALLIPSFGLAGAALATLLAAVASLALCVVMLRRLLSLRLAPRVLVLVPVAAALTVALAMAFDRLAPDNRLLTVAFCGVAYLGYLGLLTLFGVLLGAKADEKRVLLVTKPLAPPFNDGAKVVPRALLHSLDPTRIAVVSTKVGRRVLEQELGAGCPEVLPVYRGGGTFGPRGLDNAVVFAYLLVARFHYRALHFFFAPNPLTCRAIRLLRALSPGVSFVQTVMSRPQSYDAGKALVFGDVITAGSEDTARKLEEATGRQVRVVRPGIACDVESEPRDVVLSRLKLSLDGFHVLYAGDLDEGGALPHLARIAPALLEREPRACFHLSVRRKSPSTEGLARAFYDEHLARFGDRARMYFDHAPFRELLDMADAMVLPQEHLVRKVDAPLVVLEQMARGKPVFLLDRPPLDEIPPPSLRDRLLARSCDELSEQLLAFAREPALISAEALRAHVKERFDIERAAREYEDIHGRA